MENHSLVRCGFRFKPTDQELIHHFLRDFLMKRRPLLLPPYNTIIHEWNLFGKRSEPSEIWEAYEGGTQLTDQALYSFSELKKLNPMGSHIDRKIGSGGTWNDKAVATLVKGTDENPSPIGLKRTFCYKNEGSEDHGGWLLDEYSLFACPRNNYVDTRYDFDYVLCRLRKKDGSSGINKRKCSTSEDQATSSKKKKRANEKIEKDDQSGSKQNMNAINVAEEEGRQRNSCLTNDLVVCDHEIDDFTVGDDVAHGYDIDPTVVDENMTILGQEFQEVTLPTASGVVVADGEQALNSSMLEELISETQELPLPAASGIAEDGAV